MGLGKVTGPPAQVGSTDQVAMPFWPEAQRNGADRREKSMGSISTVYSYHAIMGHALTGAGLRDGGLRKLLLLRKIWMLPVLAIALVACSSAPYPQGRGEVTMIQTDYGRFHVQKDPQSTSGWGARLSMLDEIPPAEDLRKGGIEAIEKVSNCPVAPDRVVVVGEDCRRFFDPDPAVYAQVTCG